MIEKPSAEFQERLKKLRQEMGYSVEELAQDVGVSKTTVHRWENGEIKNLRQENIGKLAQTLHTSPSNLLGWGKTAEDDTEFDGCTPEEQELIKLYRKASLADRDIVERILLKYKKSKKFSHNFSYFD